MNDQGHDVADPVSSPTVPSTAPGDTPILCPDCDYNLTGLTENRCPECGREFDPHRLLRWATEHNLPLTFWPRANVSHFRIAFETLFRPSLLGRQLPSYPASGSGRAYSISLRLLAVGGAPLLMRVLPAALMGQKLAHHGRMLLWPIVLGLILLASAVCEVAVAGLLSALVAPKHVSREARYEFWHSLTRVFVIHLSLTNFCMWGILGSEKALGYSATPVPWSPLLPLIVFLALVVCWWLGLSCAIVARSAPSLCRALTIVLIPVVGVGCMLVAVILLGALGIAA